MGFSPHLGKREEIGRHYFYMVKNRGSGTRQSWIRIPALWLPRLRFCIYKMQLILTVIVIIILKKHTSQVSVAKRLIYIMSSILRKTFRRRS